jgi:hypothetical protein
MAAARAVGEFTLVIAPPALSEVPLRGDVSDELLATEFGYMTETCGIERRDALRTLGEKYHLSKKLVYAAILRQRESVK